MAKTQFSNIEPKHVRDVALLVARRPMQWAMFERPPALIDSVRHGAACGGRFAMVRLRDRIGRPGK